MDIRMIEKMLWRKFTVSLIVWCVANSISTRIVILQELGIRGILKIIPDAFHPPWVQPLSRQNFSSSLHLLNSPEKYVQCTLQAERMQTLVWKIELDVALSNFLVTILSFPLKIHILAIEKHKIYTYGMWHTWYLSFLTNIFDNKRNYTLYSQCRITH